MRLTVRTDYALRVLMYLAVHDDRLATIREIAERYMISRRHLMTIAYELGRAGFIDTVQGHGGGLRLARPADAISVGAVARQMEQSSPLVECFPGGAGECRIAPCCGFKVVLAEAQEAFFAVLARHTIHDLVDRNPGLRALLLADAERFGRAGEREQ